MILPVSNFNSSVNFTGDKAEKLPYAKDTLLKNNFSTRARIGLDKLTNALTLYPIKGFKGDKNANFYEFLTMGNVPYLVGSLMMMSVFNSKNKVFAPFAAAKAGAIGRKMALGVLFYGALKSISKTFVTNPIKWFTGVDTEVPYAKVIYELPDDIYDTDIMSIEYHKAFESKDFPRWDLFYKSEAKGEQRNEYFDKIAKRLGYGENLKDSDQEMKPVIKQIAVKTNLAKTVSSYLWAATGVCLAFQNSWDDYFKAATYKFWQTDKFAHSLKVFGRSAKDAAKSLWKGSGAGLEKHAGKIMVGTAVASTIFGIINAIPFKKFADPKNVIDDKRKYVVN